MENNPILVVLWVTGKCNLKCKYCYASADMQRDDMNFETAIKAVERFKDRPMKIQFAGGEPLLNTNLIFKLIDYVRSEGIEAAFQLQTNATLITDDIADEIRIRRIALGVSLDGPPQINEVLRGGTLKTVKGLQILAQHNIRVNINSVVTAQNVRYLDKLPEFVLYFGNAAGIGLDLLRSTGRAAENCTSIQPPSAYELRESMKLMYHRCKDLHRLTGNKIVLREIEEAKKRLKQPICSEDYCYASCGRSYVVVPNGDIYPCGSLIDETDYHMGNIHEGEIRSVSLNAQPRNGCKGCKYQPVCPGSCPSRVLTNGIGQVADSLDCVMRKTAFEIAENDV